jgi:beta-glucosidase
MNVDTIKNFFGQGKKMQFADHRDIVRGLGADSIVLLKNNKLLPINKGKIALFGAGAVDTLFHGIFYNNVCTDKNVSVCEGLVNNGFTITTGSWLAKMEKAVKQQRIESKQKDTFEECIGITPEVPISAADLAESVLGTKTCIYVIRHGITAKNTDDYYQLTEVEQSNIKIVAETFENVILVLNSSMLEISQVARMKNVKAILYMGVPGMEAGNSLADVLTGAVNPSGHLTCTWAKKYKD